MTESDGIYCAAGSALAINDILSLTGLHAGAKTAFTQPFDFAVSMILHSVISVLIYFQDYISVNFIALGVGEANS